MKVVLGLLLGLCIGAACRWLDLPVPSPPKLVGALLVVAMTLGYIGADALMAKKFAHKGPAMAQELSGGPTGSIKASQPLNAVGSNEKQDPL